MVINDWDYRTRRKRLTWNKINLDEKSVEELSGIFHNLFFLNVSVTRGGVFDIHTVPSFVVSVYRNSNDAIIGALLLDIPAAACLAGAL